MTSFDIFILNRLRPLDFLKALLAILMMTYILTAPLDVQASPREVVIWVWGGGGIEEIEVNGTKVYLSPPPPFINLSLESLFLADAIATTKLHTLLKEYAERGGMVLVFSETSSNRTGEWLRSEHLGQGLICYFNGSLKDALPHFLKLPFVKTVEKHTVLAITYNGPTSPPLGVLELKGRSFIRRLLDVNKAALTVEPGVYKLSLYHLFHEERPDAYPISVGRSVAINLTLYVKSKLYIVRTRDLNLSVSGATLAETFENSGFIIDIYEIVAPFSDYLKTRIEYDNVSVAVNIPSGGDYVYQLVGIENLSKIVVRDQRGEPLPNPHVVLEYTVGSKSYVWAWRGGRDGTIYVPKNLNNATSKSWLILSYANTPLPYAGGRGLIKVKERRYLIAELQPGSYAYFYSKEQGFVPARVYNSISGSIYIVATPRSSTVVATVYSKGERVRTELPLKPPGTISYFENLVLEAMRASALAELESAREALREAEEEFKKSGELTAYAISVEDLINRAKELVGRAEKELNESRFVAAKYAAEAAIDLARKAVSLSAKSRISSGANIVLLLVFTAFSAIALSSILFTGYTRVVAAITISVALWAAIYVLHPGVAFLFSPEDPLTIRRLLLLASVLTAFTYLVLVEIPSYFEDQDPEKAGLIATLAIVAGLATRNLRRRPLRTVLTAFTIGIAVFAFISFTSVGYGISVIKTPTPIPSTNKMPAIKVMARLYTDEVSVVKDLAPEAVPVPRYMSSSEYLLAKDKARYRVEGLLGVDFEKEDAVSSISSIIVSGGKPEGRDWVMISEEAAKALNVKPGDYIDVYFAGGYLHLTKLRVAAIFSSGKMAAIRDVDGSYLRPSKYVSTEYGGGRQLVDPEALIIVSTETARRLWASLHGYVFYLSDKKKAEGAAVSIAERLGVPVALAVEGRSHIYYRVLGLRVTGSEATIIFVISCFVAANAMLAAVYERRKELAIYTALGMNPSHVQLVFVVESLLLGLSVVGLASLAALAFISLVPRVPSLASLKPSLTPEWLLLASFLAVATSVIAGLKPAEKASMEVVPSLIRRWSFAKIRHGVIREELPFKIDAHLIERHLEFMKKRIESVYPPHSVLLRTKTWYEKRGDTWVLTVEADLVSEGRVSAVFTLTYRPLDSKFYGVTLEAKPTTVSKYHYLEVAYAIADEIRKSMLAWQALYR